MEHRADKLEQRGRLLKKGDLICCHDSNDMVHTMIGLSKAGIEVDFYYGRAGWWLEVTADEETTM